MPTHTKIAIAVVATLLAIGAGVAFNHSGSSVAAPAAAPASDKHREVASVNGQALTDADLTPYLLQGADRAVAIDRAINKALAAELASKEFARDTETAVAAARRDVAAQVYLSKKSEHIAKSLTDKDLQERYDVVVKDADFNAYKVRLGVFASEQEALDTRTEAMKGGSDARVDKKFQVLGASGGYIGRGDLPYDLGVVIAKMKSGDYSAPVATRNGILVLHLVDVRKNDRPKFEDIKSQLSASLVQERVNQSLATAREASVIMLK